VPVAGLPVTVPLTVRSLLVGRTSKSRNIHPEIDCGADIGVSRRHAQLTTDGTRWWIEDLKVVQREPYVGTDSGPLPVQPVTPGQRHELSEGGPRLHRRRGRDWWCAVPPTREVNA